MPTVAVHDFARRRQRAMRIFGLTLIGHAINQSVGVSAVNNRAAINFKKKIACAPRRRCDFFDLRGGAQGLYVRAGAANSIRHT